MAHRNHGPETLDHTHRSLDFGELCIFLPSYHPKLGSASQEEAQRSPGARLACSPEPRGDSNRAGQELRSNKKDIRRTSREGGAGMQAEYWCTGTTQSHRATRNTMSRKEKRN